MPTENQDDFPAPDDYCFACGYIDCRCNNDAAAERLLRAIFEAPEPPSPAFDSHASVSPEQTPTAAADSAHRGDQCTDGETP